MCIFGAGHRNIFLLTWYPTHKPFSKICYFLHVRRCIILPEDMTSTQYSQFIFIIVIFVIGRVSESNARDIDFSKRVHGLPMRFPLYKNSKSITSKKISDYGNTSLCIATSMVNIANIHV